MKIEFYFLGVSTTQMLLLVYYFVIFKRIEFLNYLFYVLCYTAGFSFVFFPGLFGRLSENMGRVQLLHTGFSLLMLALLSYYQFFRHIVKLELKNSTLNSIVRIAEWVIGITALSIFISGNTVNPIIAGIMRIVYLGNILVQLTLLIYFIRNRPVFFELLLIAGTFVSGLLTKWVVAPVKWVTDPAAILSSDVNPSLARAPEELLIAIACNFLFINFLLIYRSREVELRLMKADLQKQQELLRQREEISLDLHDEIGGNLSALEVYAEVAEKIQDNDPAAAKAYMRRIQTRLREVMVNFSDVIWSLQGSGLKERSLISRIQDFYVDVFDARNIEIQYTVDERLNQSILNSKARKNLTLIAREAINNAVKHSKATSVQLSLLTEGKNLLLMIADNGIGLNEHAKTKGLGLRSMTLRAREIGGEISFCASKNGLGLVVNCSVPIANIS